MAKKQDSGDINIKKFIGIGLLILVAVALASFAYSSVTSLSHVYQHNPGECHIDRECQVGEICLRPCLAPESCVTGKQTTGCTEQAEIGKCSKICSSNDDCPESSCKQELFWHAFGSKTINVCSANI